MRSIRRFHPRNALHRRTAGFTLLEVLLTAILSATLMAGLWSLFGTYLRLFETGQARVERSSLLRALDSQFTVDLQSVVPPQPDSKSTSTSGSRTDARTSDANFLSTTQSDVQQAGLRAPQFVLAGNDRTLRLEVLQNAPSLVSSDTSNRELPGIGVASEPRATQLRTILYSFEHPRDLSANDRDPPPGLLRRELTWEETQGNSRKKGATSSAAQSAEQSELAEGFPQMTSADLLEDSANESAIWTPEIIALRFRYFDGQSWRERWDSRQQKTLPIAVEIAYRLEPIETTRRAGAVHDRLNQSLTSPILTNQAGGTRESDSKSSVSNDDSLASFDFDDAKGNSAASEDGHLPVFRQIVSLGSSVKGGARSNNLQSEAAFTPVTAETNVPQEAQQP